jgi:multidrug efflux pump subunit AcrA (membrane-fusion protein)
MTEAEPETAAVRSRRPVVLTIAAFAILVIATVLVAPHLFSGDPSSTSLEYATAATSSFPVTLSATGTAVPEAEVGVNFGTSGQVTAVNVAVGQHVARGTVIASLDTTGPRSDIARAEAALSSANAALTAAEVPLDPARQAQLQAALTSAQEIYTATASSVQTAATEDTAVVSSDQQQVTLDQQRLAADACSTVSPSNALVCQSDQQAITSDHGRLVEDEARQRNDAANGQLRVSQAQAQVTQSQQAISVQSAGNPAQVAAAQAAVSSANAQLQQAQSELANSTLVAPTSGTVLELNGQVGENVTGGATNSMSLPGTTAPIPPPPAGASSSATGSGSGASNQPFAVIGSSSRYVVGVPFPATDAPQLKAYQTGTITPSSLGAPIPAHVLAVAPDSTLVNGTSVIYATVVPNVPATGLIAGITVNVTIQVAQANSVLAVPVSAVYLVGGVPHVDVWTGKHAVSTQVTTGLQGTSLVQITSGLNAGEQVVRSAYQGLSQSATTVLGSP